MLNGFPPVASPDARLLVLGSMPGERSLADQQYYAQPRNAFWTIMGVLFGAGPELPYAERCACLQQMRVAVWDVLARCHRQGSLDQKIRLADAELNDFDRFFEHHPQITAVACNGQLAGRLFSRRVLPRLAIPGRLQVHVLPSTSPAMASLSLAQKINRWEQALSPFRSLARVPGEAHGQRRGPGSAC